MKNVARAVALYVAVSMPVAAVFGQGMTWESKVINNGHEMVTHSSYMPKMIKVTGVNDDGYVIMRIDQEKVYSVRTKEKTYSVMTFAEVEQMGKQMNAQMEQMQQQMKDMPEEQRKMMEKMLGGNMPGEKKEPKIDVVRTGEQKSINGFACTRYSVKENGKEKISVWVTPEVKVFAAMKQDLVEQARRMSAMTPGGFKGLLEAMQKVDGFPIETEMGTTMKTTVTKVDTKTIPASEFEVPAGFTKVENTIPGRKTGK